MKVCCAVVVFFVRSIVVLRYFVFSMSTDDVKREIIFCKFAFRVVFYASITAVTYVRYMYFMSPFSVYAYAIGPL